MHLDALMRRLIHLRGPFPIVIGGTGRLAVMMLPQMHHFMAQGGQHRLDAACAGLFYCAIQFLVRSHGWERISLKEGILRQLGQCDQQQDEEYYQTRWQQQALPVLMLCLPTLPQGGPEPRS